MNSKNSLIDSDAVKPLAVPHKQSEKPICLVLMRPQAS